LSSHLYADIALYVKSDIAKENGIEIEGFGEDGAKVISIGLIEKCSIDISKRNAPFCIHFSDANKHKLINQINEVKFKNKRTLVVVVGSSIFYIDATGDSKFGNTLVIFTNLNFRSLNEVLKKINKSILKKSKLGVGQLKEQGKP